MEVPKRDRPDSHPQMGSPLRRDFERSITRGDKLKELMVRIDVLTSRINTQFDKTGDLDDPAIQTYLDEIINLVEELLSELEDKVDQKKYADNWVLYYRLRMFSDMLIPQIIMPLLMKNAPSGTADRAHRASIIDGIYGCMVDILDDALQTYSEGPERGFDEQDYQEMRGVITEITTIALLNHDQQIERIGILSSFEDDVYHRVDARIISRTPQSFTSIPVQIKTSPTDVTPADIPENGILITAAQIGNYRAQYNSEPPFRGSRLLVKEVQGIITDEEKVELDELFERFKQFVSESIDVIPDQSNIA